jgi:hypothetical protein
MGAGVMDLQPCSRFKLTDGFERQSDAGWAVVEYPGYPNAEHLAFDAHIPGPMQC